MDGATPRDPAPPRWLLRVGFLSDTGLSRERNEDALALFVPYGSERSTAAVDAYFLVADGMGGHEAGDVASRLAAERVAAALEMPDDGEAVPPRLERVFRDLNRELVALAAERGLARGLGTTLTVAALSDTTLHLAHIGDTRCYRLRAGDLEQLTDDHSWVAEQLRSGHLTAEEAVGHPQRNVLTRCLGTNREPELLSASHEVRDADRYLLCSDGLHGAVDDTLLHRVLREEHMPQAAARRLVDLANDAGGDDNITAVVVDISTRDAGTASGASAETTLRAVAPTITRSRAARGARVLVAIGAVLIAGALAAAIALTPRRATAPDARGRVAPDTTSTPGFVQPGPSAPGTTVPRPVAPDPPPPKE